ncbi:DUF883 family protein [Candidatus Methylacidithermus pantelleriae]|uniref:DUF883 domain-containing protein n=1 Tax=Candidatus Methylacidithermus pantelleriae TaxID=2744239 RepID=A0A8J2BJP4_9BACT|nr:DUF883 family protein [Candidatus Methylacidithermus pantelleriae]CAF0689769.1 conserved hypothetical protein [Candidatus Methylacidithermus pantelleriae]
MDPSIHKEKLAQDLRELIRDAEDLLRLTANEVGDAARDLRERLSSKISELRGDLGQVEDTLRERAAAGARETDRLIREHPYESVAVAFVVGFLLGVVAGRR